MAYIKAGHGFHVGRDFGRVIMDTPIREIELGGFCEPRHVIAWIDGNPTSKLGFMRAERVRAYVSFDCIALDQGDDPLE